MLSLSRVQVGNITQTEPFVAAKVAAAPLEYLEYLANATCTYTDLAALYSQCEQMRLSLGENALKGTRFEDLSDVPDPIADENFRGGADTVGGGVTLEGGGGVSTLADSPPELLTPEQLRAMVQRRVADAAKDAGLQRRLELNWNFTLQQPQKSEVLKDLLDFGELSETLGSKAANSLPEPNNTAAAVCVCV